mmetsp:Transcript_6062/g.16988  ORF Transcript_6062/g.16988 Transcript_6062/m.16988 type:complete len:267 (-) Transcript_6062:362-1162(-)
MFRNAMSAATLNSVSDCKWFSIASTSFAVEEDATLPSSANASAPLLRSNACLFPSNSVKGVTTGPATFRRAPRDKMAPSATMSGTLSSERAVMSVGKAPSASLPSLFNVTIAASRPDTLLPKAVSSTLLSYRAMAAIFCTNGCAAAPKLPNTSTHAARIRTFGSWSPTTSTSFAGKDSWPRDCNAFAASLVPMPYASSGPMVSLIAAANCFTTGAAASPRFPIAFAAPIRTEVSGSDKQAASSSRAGAAIGPSCPSAVAAASRTSA